MHGLDSELRQSDQCDVLPQPDGISKSTRTTGVGEGSLEQAGVHSPVEEAEEEGVHR